MPVQQLKLMEPGYKARRLINQQVPTSQFERHRLKSFKKTILSTFAG
jgi:hypothetical protein